MGDRELWGGLVFSIIAASIFSGIVPSPLIWAEVIFASSIFLDDLSTFIFVSMDGSVENESNDVAREYMRKHGIIRGIMLSHCAPLVIVAYISIMAVGALFGCVVFFIRSDAGYSTSLEVIPATSLVFVGIHKNVWAVAPNVFGIVVRWLAKKEIRKLSS